MLVLIMLTAGFVCVVSACLITCVELAEACSSSCLRGKVSYKCTCTCAIPKIKPTANHKYTLYGRIVIELSVFVKFLC